MTLHQFLSPFRGLGGLLSSLWAGILIAIAGWGGLANPVLGMFLFCVGQIAVFICFYLNATRCCVAFFFALLFAYIKNLLYLCTVNCINTTNYA